VKRKEDNHQETDLIVGFDLKATGEVRGDL